MTPVLRIATIQDAPQINETTATTSRIRWLILPSRTKVWKSVRVRLNSSFRCIRSS